MRKKVLQNSWSYGSKVIHIEKPRKPQKWSYARTYSRYPQKTVGLEGVKKR